MSSEEDVGSDQSYDPVQPLFDNDINEDEDLKALEQFDIMSRIPGMTEEKWESLTEFQREELINEYDSEREKQKELRRLRDKKKGKKRTESADKQALGFLRVVIDSGASTAKKVKRDLQPISDFIEDDSENSFIDDEEDEGYGEKQKKKEKAKTAKKPKKTVDHIELEDLETIYLPRKKILSLLQNAFFDDILRNAYVLHRETIGKHHIYLLRKVVNVKECSQEYVVDDILCNKILVLTYGDDVLEVDVNAVSNDTLKPEDFQAFVEEREHHGEKLMTKAECKKRSEKIKELETKTPTEKDMASIVARRQLTVDVHRINTVRLQGDLRIKKDKLENDLRGLQTELAKAHSHAYTELDTRREELEKELTEVNSRLEELAAEESERIRLLQERDVQLKNIAAKHQRWNQELMKHAGKTRSDGFLSRQPTLPSVSWCTGTEKKVVGGMIIPEPVKKCEEKKVNRVTVEDFHHFELTLDEPVKPAPEKVVPEGNRQRSGMSLAEYRKRYG